MRGIQYSVLLGIWLIFFHALSCGSSDHSLPEEEEAENEEGQTVDPVTGLIARKTDKANELDLEWNNPPSIALVEISYLQEGEDEAYTVIANLRVNDESKSSYLVKLPEYGTYRICLVGIDIYGRRSEKVTITATPAKEDSPPTKPEDIYDIKVSNMRIRDPFILVDREDQVYYMHVNGKKKVRVYKSKDLSMWKDMGIAFDPGSDFWGKTDFWAPDVYYYKNKYYLFITLSAPNIKRGTSILVADKPEGPFVPLVNRAVTPPEWMCLDGALYVDKDKIPWIIYCHEWLEAIDGEVVAQQLREDLTETIGEPKILFRASEASWVGNISSGNTTGKVTDAPFIHTLDNGQLIMLWSSFRKDGKYAIGQATSKSGNLLGPWRQQAEPLNNDDGGHAMLFNDIEGRLMISYHAPNSNTERPIIKHAYINNNGKVVISD